MTERALTCHTHDLFLLFLKKKKTVFPWLGEKSDFPVPLGPGMKQFSVLMLTPGQRLRLSSWARLLGLLSSDLFNKNTTSGPQWHGLSRWGTGEGLEAGAETPELSAWVLSSAVFFKHWISYLTLESLYLPGKWGTKG